MVKRRLKAKIAFFRLLKHWLAKPPRDAIPMKARRYPDLARRYPDGRDAIPMHPRRYPDESATLSRCWRATYPQASTLTARLSDRVDRSCPCRSCVPALHVRLQGMGPSAGGLPVPVAWSAAQRLQPFPLWLLGLQPFAGRPLCHWFPIPLAGIWPFRLWSVKLTRFRGRRPCAMPAPAPMVQPAPSARSCAPNATSLQKPRFDLLGSPARCRASFPIRELHTCSQSRMAG